MRTRITGGPAKNGTAANDENSSYEIPRRDFKRPERSTGGFGDRDESPRRSFGGGGDDRPRRSFGGGDDRPRRSFGGGDDRPRRSFGDRDDRPRRSFGGGDEGPRRRSYGERDEKLRKNTATSPVRKQTFDPDTVRLNKFIANSGVCSRREADEHIAMGLITVNDVVITELGIRVNINDEIKYNGESLKGEKKVYIIMNKPKDFVTTTSDPHAEKCVMDLINTELCPERVFPVGRLDKSTTGILLFTNDGALTETLTHPSYKRKKIYQVSLDKNLKKPDFDALLTGLELEDGVIAADTLSYIGESEDKIGIEVHSGRNRVVRRMFEHLGYDVKKLDRVYFAGLTKKNIRRGQWRFLTDEEISILKMGGTHE